MVFPEKRSDPVAGMDRSVHVFIYDFLSLRRYEWTRMIDEVGHERPKRPLFAP